MNLQPKPEKLPDVLQLIEEGHLLLPEFQRPAKWSAKDEEELIRTVARGWPCGVMLALEGDGGMKYRPLADAPTLGKPPKSVLLDGQQRLTALYRAFRDRGKRTYFIDLGAMTEQGALLDEHVKTASAAKFTKQYGNIDGNARKLVARVSRVSPRTS